MHGEDRIRPSRCPTMSARHSALWLYLAPVADGSSEHRARAHCPRLLCSNHPQHGRRSDVLDGRKSRCKGDAGGNSPAILHRLLSLKVTFSRTVYVVAPSLIDFSPVKKTGILPYETISVVRPSQSGLATNAKSYYPCVVHVACTDYASRTQLANVNVTMRHRSKS